MPTEKNKSNIADKRKNSEQLKAKFKSILKENLNGFVDRDDVKESGMKNKREDGHFYCY